ncbi:MAG: hypothetical protein JWN22_3103 [Nocardioides sp.]|jgi:hypothetical protein|nr:hypothetical protein [Nocardioides sp.]
MNVVRMSSRLAATGAVTALAAAALVSVGTTAANAATVMNTYTCSAPGVYTGDFPLTVTGELPVPQYFADAPVPAGLLGITVTAQVPADAAQLLGAFGVDGAKSDDFGFALGTSTAPVPITGPFNTAGDGSVTWDATGTNGAFRTPTPGHYDALLPQSFTLMTTSGGNDVAALGCVLKTGETAAALTSIDLIKQNSTTTSSPKVKVAKGKKAKVPTSVGASNGGTPTGKVVAKEGTKTVGTATVKAGKAVVTLMKLKPGKHKIVLSYGGNASINGSSDTTTVTVAK